MSDSLKFRIEAGIRQFWPRTITDINSITKDETKNIRYAPLLAYQHDNEMFYCNIKLEISYRELIILKSFNLTSEYGFKTKDEKYILKNIQSQISIELIAKMYIHAVNDSTDKINELMSKEPQFQYCKIVHISEQESRQRVAALVHSNLQ